MPKKCHNCGSIEETIRESETVVTVDCSECGVNKRIQTKGVETDAT